MVDFNCHLDTIYNHLGIRFSEELSRLSGLVSMLFFLKITEVGGSILNMAAPLHELDPGLDQKGKHELNFGLYPHVLSLFLTVDVT